MKLLGALLVGAACVAHVSSAAACGAVEPPYYVVSGTWPEDVAAPRNAPIVVTLEEGEDGPVYASLDPRLTLTREGDDQAVSLVLNGTAPRLSWTPREPLFPNTRYQAYYNPGYEGVPDTIWQFSTSDELTPPLAAVGDISVTFEAGTAPVLECTNNCGTGCTTVGTRDVMKAHVQLPRAKDGFPSYHGEVWLTDDTPYEFLAGAPDSGPTPRSHVVSLGTWVSYDDQGEPSQAATFTVPEEDAPYRPCFAFRLTDERGDHSAVQTFCAEAAFPAASNEVGDSAETSSACRFGRESAPLSAFWGLVAVFALWTRRRHQP